MPSGSKRRKSAKKKKDEVVVPACHEDSANERDHDHGNDNEDDGISPKTPVQAREGDGSSPDAESGSPTYDGSKQEEQIQENSFPDTQGYQNHPVESTDISLGVVDNRSESSCDILVHDNNGLTESPSPFTDAVEPHPEEDTDIKMKSSVQSSEKYSGDETQESELDARTDVASVFTSSEIVGGDESKLQVLSSGEVEDKHKEIQSAGSFTDLCGHFLAESSDITVGSQSNASEVSDDDESKLEVVSSTAVVDPNESVQSLGSVDSPRSFQSMNCQRFSEHNSYDTVILTSQEQECESEGVLETPWKELSSEANIPVSLVHVDDSESPEDQDGQINFSNESSLDFRNDEQIHVTNEVRNISHATLEEGLAETQGASLISSVASVTESELTCKVKENNLLESDVTDVALIKTESSEMITEPMISLQPVTLLHTNQPGSANSVIFSASHGTFMNAGGGAFGVLPLPKNEESLSSPKKLENQKKRRDRSRVSGSRRKKTKADSTTDLVLRKGDVGNGKLSGSKSHKRASCAERTEKISGKKQSCQGIKKSEDGIEQRGGSLNENCLKDSALHGSSNSGSTGILDIYGLKTMPIDLSNKIVDISVNDLLSENFHPPQSVRLGKERKQSGLDNCLINDVGKVLELMPKPSYMDDKKLKMENSSYGPWLSAQREDTCEMVLSEDGSTRKCTASSEDSAFPVAKFPLYPMQDFVSRLGLPANECLENLLVQPHRELDTRINESSRAYKTSSIPPLQYSLLPNGVCRSFPKRDKEIKNGSPWLRGGIAKCVTDSLGLGLGLGLGLDIKSMANVECKQTIEERQNRQRCEEIDKAGVIDLNLQSSEQLLDSSTADRHNCSLSPDPMQGFPCYSMNTILTEGRMKEEKVVECIETGCYLEANCHISEDDNVRRKNTCTNKENELEKPTILQGETVKTTTTEIQDVKNNSWIAIETKTNQALEKMGHFTGDEKPEDQGQRVRDSVEDGRAPLTLSKHGVQMDEPCQPLPSQLHTSPLDLDKSVSSTDDSSAIPNSPRSEEAARILIDMVNSQSYDNEASLDQENSPDPDLLQQESFKGSHIVERVVDSQNISNGGLKFTSECKYAKTKTPTNEKRKSLLQGSLLVGKHWPPRNSMTPESQPNPLPNGTFDLVLRNHNTHKTGKDIQGPDTTEAEKTSDLLFHSWLSRPSKTITDDTHMRAKGSTLYTSNQIRGDLQRKSLGGDKVHVSTKSSQKPRIDNGNQKLTLLGGQNQQKISIVGHAKSSRQTAAYAGRKR